MSDKASSKLAGMEIWDEAYMRAQARDYAEARNDPAVYELYVFCVADNGETWDAGLYLHGKFENERAAYLYFRESVIGIGLFWKRIECTMKRQDGPTWEGRFVIEGERGVKGE